MIAIDPVAVINRANDTKKREELLQLKNSLQLYHNDNTTYPPDTAPDDGEPDGLTPTYMRSLPDSFGDGDAEYSGPGENGVPAGEYIAAVDLDRPSADDTATFATCGSVPVGWDATYDYFICPD